MRALSVPVSGLVVYLGPTGSSKQQQQQPHTTLTTTTTTTTQRSAGQTKALAITTQYKAVARQDVRLRLLPAQPSPVQARVCDWLAACCSPSPRPSCSRSRSRRQSYSVAIYANGLDFHLSFNSWPLGRCELLSTTDSQRFD